jgi:hypothetical protein
MIVKVFLMVFLLSCSTINLLTSPEDEFKNSDLVSGGCSIEDGNSSSSAATEMDNKGALSERLVSTRLGGVGSFSSFLYCFCSGIHLDQFLQHVVF